MNYPPVYPGLPGGVLHYTIPTAFPHVAGQQSQQALAYFPGCYSAGAGALGARAVGVESNTVAPSFSPLGAHQQQQQQQQPPQAFHLPAEQPLHDRLASGGSPFRSRHLHTGRGKVSRPAPPAVTPYQLPAKTSGISQRLAQRSRRRPPPRPLPPPPPSQPPSLTTVTTTPCLPEQLSAPIPSPLLPQQNPPQQQTHLPTPLSSTATGPQSELKVSAPLHVMAQGPSDPAAFDSGAWDEFQELSNKYEPEATGPLVGDRQPSTQLTAEYAAADPVYQVKTATLPQKYSHYRTVRGDGKCGWRAIAFGYFEALIRQGDAGIFEVESARMLLLRANVAKAGIPMETVEEFFDQVVELLGSLSSAMATGTADDVLLETFNDDGVQQYIVYCMKILTSSWISTHQEDYAPYMVNETVEHFCKYIETVDSEMDHRSLNALHSVLLSDIDIAMEVLYLDRSEGEEVNSHQWGADTGSTPRAHIRLLYRPGHYDILYKQEDMPPAPEPVTTYLLHNSTQQDFLDIQCLPYDMPDPMFLPDMFYQMDDDPTHLMCQIPGMSYVREGVPANWLASGNGSLQGPFTADPVQPLAAVPASTQDLNLQSMPTFLPGDNFVDPPIPTHVITLPEVPEVMIMPPLVLPEESQLLPSPSMHTPRAPLPFHTAPSRDPFRKSSVQYNHENQTAAPVIRCPQSPLRTREMLQSPCNPANFGNEDFEPIIYDPRNPKASEKKDGTGSGGRTGRSRARKS